MWSVCSRLSDASQARRMFSADRNVSFGQSPEVELGGEPDLLAPAAARGEPSADDLFGDAFAWLRAVHVRRVEEVDAVLQRTIHDRMTVLFGRFWPEVHGAEYQPGHGKAAAAKTGVLHVFQPFRRRWGRTARRSGR
jgi:hypothetical protein